MIVRCREFSDSDFCMDIGIEGVHCTVRYWTVLDSDSPSMCLLLYGITNCHSRRTFAFKTFQSRNDNTPCRDITTPDMTQFQFRHSRNLLLNMQPKSPQGEIYHADISYRIPWRFHVILLFSSHLLNNTNVYYFTIK